MKTVIIISLILNGILASTNNTCAKFASGSKNEARNCFYMLPNESRTFYFTFDNCKGNEYCPIEKRNDTEPFANVTCTVVPKEKLQDLPPGDVCTSHRQCASKSCKKRRCQSVEKGAACLSTNACPLGQYCDKKNYTDLTSNGTCSDPKKAGLPCTIDDECELGTACFNAACTFLFSIPDGQPTRNKFLCQSGYSVKVNDIEYCTSKNEASKGCFVNQIQNLPGFEVQLQCNSKGDLVCPVPTKNFVSIVQKILKEEFNKSQGNVSMARRFRLADDAANAIDAWIALEIYPGDNDETTNFTVNPLLERLRYSEPVRRTLSSSILSIGFGVFFAVLLTILN